MKDTEQVFNSECVGDRSQDGLNHNNIDDNDRISDRVGLYSFRHFLEEREVLVQAFNSMIIEADEVNKRTNLEYESFLSKTFEIMHDAINLLVTVEYYDTAQIYKYLYR